MLVRLGLLPREIGVNPRCHIVAAKPPVARAEAGVIVEQREGVFQQLVSGFFSLVSHVRTLRLLPALVNGRLF